MLQKTQRLNLKKDFSFVAAGKKFETAHLRIFARWGVNNSPKVGIALSKKNFRKSYQRNRAKHIVSTAIHSEYLNLHSQLNLVIMPKGPILECKVDDITKELRDVKDLYKND